MLDTTGLRLAHGATTHKIIGAFYDVYNALGHGFLESVYAGAMPIALLERGLTVEREVPFPVTFHDKVIGEYRADLVVESNILVELKAAERISPAFEGQLLNYLRASGISVGLLLNFGPRPTTRRMILTTSQACATEQPSTDTH